MQCLYRHIFIFIVIFYSLFALGFAEYTTVMFTRDRNAIYGVSGEEQTYIITKKITSNPLDLKQKHTHTHIHNFLLHVQPFYHQLKIN